MYCGECGKRLHDGARFCGNCGAPTEAAGSLAAGTPEDAASSPPAAPAGVTEPGGLRGIAILPGGALAPAGNRQATCTVGGRLPGLLHLSSDRLSFRTQVGTVFDVPLADVTDVCFPNWLTRRGAAGSDLRCRIAGAPYQLIFLRLLWPDEDAETILQRFQRQLQPRGGKKTMAKEVIKSTAEIVDIAGLGAGRLVGSVIERGVDKALGEKEEEKPDDEPEIRPPRNPPRTPAANVFLDALTGKPVPTELTDPAAAKALDAGAQPQTSS